ncbi:protein kinase [Stieleria sp.]|uniref:protein kinase domain-containing protein n=1 Tax=Stieleria sp. TaxID=2795976 RepID=UPI0035687E71
MIAGYLDAEKTGRELDRDELMNKHPNLADSLREFFVNHDRLKAVTDGEEPSRTPNGTGSNDPTLAPTQSPVMHGPTVGQQVRYFGDYELLEEIARGGMGVVFKARQINLNRIVALKMILAGELAGEEEIRRFKSEAEAAAQLDHPGIVPIFEIGEYDGKHYFSMGFVDGESLAAHMPDGPLPPKEAAELTTKICAAVQYAHEKGVIHRDLKPGNVLMDPNGIPRVTDFGLAKQVAGESDLTRTGQIIGTPAYMPPEQASGDTSKIGPAADIYALGAVLYTMLTGRPPFQAPSPMETLLQVLEHDPAPPRTVNSMVPVDLETICLKCLNKDISHRYRTANELRLDLQRFLDGEPILARPVGRIERTVRWCRRNPRVASLAALCFFCVAAGTVSTAVFALRARDRANMAELALYGSHVGLAHRQVIDGQFTPATWTLNKCDPERRGWEWEHVNLYANRQRTVLTSPENQRLWSLTSNGTAVFDFKSSTTFDLTTGAPIQSFPDRPALLNRMVNDLVVVQSPKDPRAFEVLNVLNGDVQCMLQWNFETQPNVALASQGDIVTLYDLNGDQLRWIAYDLNDGTVQFDSVVAGASSGASLTDDQSQILIYPHAYDVRTGARSRIPRFLPRKSGQSSTFKIIGRKVAYLIDDWTLLLTDGEIQRQLESPPRARCRGLHASDSGKYLVAKWSEQLGRDNYIESAYLYDLEYGHARKLVEQTGSERCLRDLTLSPDGSKLLLTIQTSVMESANTCLIEVHASDPQPQILQHQVGLKVTGLAWNIAPSFDRHSHHVLLPLATMDMAGVFVNALMNSVADKAEKPASEPLKLERRDHYVLWDIGPQFSIEPAPPANVARHGEYFFQRFVEGNLLFGEDGSSAKQVYGAAIPFLGFLEQPKLEIKLRGGLTRELEGAGLVTSVAFSQDSRWMATAAFGPEESKQLSSPMATMMATTIGIDRSGEGNSEITIWDTHSWKPVKKMRGHLGFITGMSFNENGTRLASVDAGIQMGNNHVTSKGQLILWDLQLGQQVFVMAGEKGDFVSVAFSRDGKSLATIGESLKTWRTSPRTLERVAVDQPVNAPPKTAKNEQLRSKTDARERPAPQRIQAAAANTRQDHKPIPTQDPPRRSTAFGIDTGSEPPIRSVLFQIPLKYLKPLAGGAVVRTNRSRQRISSYEARKLSHLDFNRRGYFTPESWQYSEDESLLIASGDSRGLVFCNSDGNQVFELRGAPPYLTDDFLSLLKHPLAELPGRLVSAIVSPDNSRLALALPDHRIVLVDPNTGKKIATLEGHLAPVRGLRFSPDGRWLASASDDRTVKVWSLKTGSPPITFRRHDAPIVDLAFRQDSAQLVSVGHGSTLYAWSPETGQIDFQSPEGIPLNRVRYGLDDRRLTAIGPWHSLVFDAAEGNLTSRYELKDDGVFQELDADGSRILRVLSDRTAQWVSAETNKPEGDPLEAFLQNTVDVRYLYPELLVEVGHGKRSNRLLDRVTGQRLCQPPRILGDAPGPSVLIVFERYRDWDGLGGPIPEKRHQIDLKLGKRPPRLAVANVAPPASHNQREPPVRAIERDALKTPARAEIGAPSELAHRAANRSAHGDSLVIRIPERMLTSGQAVDQTIVFPPRCDGIQNLAISPSGRTVALVDKQGRIFLKDENARIPLLLHQIAQSDAITGSTQRRRPIAITFIDEQHIAVAFRESHVAIVSIHSGQEVLSIATKASRLLDHNESLIVANDTTKEVEIWEYNLSKPDAKLVKNFPSPKLAHSLLPEWIAFDVNRDGTKLAIAAGHSRTNYRLNIHDVATGRLLASAEGTVEALRRRQPRGGSFPKPSVHFTSGGDLMVQGQQVHRWIQDEQSLKKTTISRLLYAVSRVGPLDAGFINRDLVVMGGKDLQTREQRLRSGLERSIILNGRPAIRVPDALPASPIQAVISDNGQRLAVSLRDGTLVVLDPSTQTTLDYFVETRLDQSNRMLVAPTVKPGQSVVSASHLRTATIKDGEIVIRTTGDDHVVATCSIADEIAEPTHLLITPSDDFLLVQDARSVCVYRLDDGHFLMRLPGSEAPCKVTFDGEDLMVNDHPYPHLFTWLSNVLCEVSGTCYAPCYSPALKRIAFADPDHRIRLIDVVNGNEIAALAGHQGKIEVMAFSPDGRWLASAGADQTVKIWSLVHNNLILTFDRHHATVLDLVFRPDSGQLISIAKDLSLFAWEPNSGNVQFQAPENVSLNQARYRSDGQRLTAIGAADCLVFNPVTNTLLVHHRASDQERLVTINFDGTEVLASNEHGTSRWLAASSWKPSATKLEFSTSDLDQIDGRLAGLLIQQGRGSLTMMKSESGQVVKFLSNHQLIRVDNGSEVVTLLDRVIPPPRHVDPAADSRDREAAQADAVLESDGNEFKIDQTAKQSLSVEKPRLTSPADKAILLQPSEGVWRFDWEVVKGAKAYRIVVREPEADVAYLDRQITNSRYVQPRNTRTVVDGQRTGWTWQVKAQDSNGHWGPWSERRTFQVQSE